MAAFKDKGFSDRLGNAADSKKAMLEKFKARPADDPELRARQLARAEEKAANDLARAERAAERKADEERLRAEREQQKAAESERLEAERLAKIEADKAAELDAKAKRDARYAARKARK